MYSPGIKSEPVYEALAADPAAGEHLLVGEGEGAAPLLRVCGQLAADAGPARLLYTPSADCDRSAELENAEPATVAIHRDRDALRAAIGQVLGEARMGTRLYVAGSEAFIWTVIAAAREAGMDEEEVRMERCGSLARPVLCVHCKTRAPAVTTNIYECPGCGLQVFVRDHFSRRLGAYQSVCVDAEAPGELPEVEELYP